MHCDLETKSQSLHGFRLELTIGFRLMYPEALFVGHGDQCGGDLLI